MQVFVQKNASHRQKKIQAIHQKKYKSSTKKTKELTKKKKMQAIDKKMQII